MRKTLLLTLSLCLSMIGMSQTADELLNTGNTKYNNKDYTGAIADYTKAIELRPGFSTAYYNRGNAKSAIKNYQEAIGDFNAVLSLDPQQKDAYTGRANAKRLLKDYDAAIQDYSKYIEFNPTASSGYTNRAFARRLMKDYAGALIDYNKAIELDPGKASPYINRAQLWGAQKDYQKAIPDYNKAIEVDPKSTSAYINRGYAKRQLKDYEGSLQDFDKALEINPKYTSAYISRGVTKMKQKDYPAALAEFNKAMEIDPKSLSAVGYRAEIFFDQGKYAESVEEYAKAISMVNTSGTMYISIIEPLSRLHRFKEAAGYYDNYIKQELKSFLTTDSSWAFLTKYAEAITNGVAKEDYDAALTSLQQAEKLYNDQQDKDDDGKNSSLTSVYALTGYVLEKLNRNSEARDVYKQALLIDASQPDIKQSIAALDLKLSEIAKVDKTPPTIEILSPKPSRSFDIESDNGNTQIIGKAKDASGIAEIKINGVAIDKPEDDGLFITELKLKSGENEVEVTATDNQGNSSSRTFTLTGTAMASVAKKKENGPTISLIAGNPQKYYAILIAESEYTDPGIPDLKNPVRDARELKSILSGSYTFGAANIDTLFNRSREDIMQAIVQRSNTLTENDNLVIFYAGHGTAEKDKFGDVDGYWIPVSAKKGLAASYISADDINKALKRSNAKHILLIADACYSGAFTRSLPGDAGKAIQKQYMMTSRKVMASGNLEPVPDNSKFLFYLKKALRDNNEKYVSAKDLFDSIYKSIINNSDNLPQYAAIKNVGDEGGEFVFIKK